MTDLQKGGLLWDANQARAARMKNYRILCGLSGPEAAALLGHDSASYYRKEMGKTTVTELEVVVIRHEFIKWRIDEIEFLKNRIRYLTMIK